MQPAQEARVFPEAFKSVLKPYRTNDKDSDYVKDFKFSVTGGDHHIFAVRATLIKTIKGECSSLRYSYVISTLS